MQQFVYELIAFIYNTFNAIRDTYLRILGNNWLNTYYDTFLQKNVFFETSLIGINITWYELLLMLSTHILLILFIVLFVKFILKLVSIFRV